MKNGNNTKYKSVWNYRRLQPAVLICCSAVFVSALEAQAVPSAVPAAPEPQQVTVPASRNDQPIIPTVPPISGYTVGVPTERTGEPAVEPARSAPAGFKAMHLIGPYRAPTVPPLFDGDATRLRSLIHDGKLYLSARDAVALAIENNLDVEVERYNLVLADTDKRRAQGGGNLRGIDYTITEPPNGVGGPGSPLLNTTAANPNPTTPTVTDLTSLNATTQTVTNLSANSSATSAYSSGPNVPLFDPNVFLESGYLRRSNSIAATSTSTSGGTSSGSGASSSLQSEPEPLTYIVGNLSLQQGFRTGAQFEGLVNNDSSVIYGSNSQRDPFSTPSTSLTLTQPLLRGAGPAVNLRFIRIANLNQRVSRLLFEQQVLETIYGASRIYYDLVSLGENVAVQQEALNAARKLESDDAAQVEQGTLAPIELLRAKALTSSSEFALTQAQGLYRTQEVILRNLLIRTNSPVFSAGFVEIVPTDTIRVPDTLEQRPIAELIDQGLARRPDLAQSELQIKTGQISANASKNQALPQLNVYANVETRGSFEQAYEQLGSTGNAIPTVPVDLALGGLRVSTIVQAGVQLNLPLRNRTAEADAARDQVQVRQVEARTEKLAEQIRQNIENDQIAVETSFAAYKAAVTSRGYQEQLLQADRDRLEFGEGTNLTVIQDLAYLAQAESTEVAARSNYKKAQIEMDRDLGDLLEKNGVSLDEAVQGKLKD
jgi:outer membrane protein TolC